MDPNPRTLSKLELTDAVELLPGKWVNKGKRVGREDARNARPCRAFITPLYYYGFSGPLLPVSGHMDRREEGTKRWTSQPPGEALKRLESLVGEWILEAKPPVGPPWPGEARATIEWHDSGAHLVERSTVEMPYSPDSCAAT